MRGHSEIEIRRPFVALLAVSFSVLGLQLGGATTELFDSRVPIDVALALGGLAAIAGAVIGFWVGSNRAGEE